MALSGSTNFNLSTTRLIELAYHELGEVPVGQSMPGELLVYGMDKLNIFLKHLRNYGVHLFIRSEISVTPVAAQFLYTIGPSGANVTAPRPHKLIDAYWRKTATTKTNTPVTILTRDQYFGLSAREVSTGSQVTQVFYDPTLTNGNLYMFPIPNATAAADYTLRLYAERPFDDLDSPSDDIQIPPSYYKAVLLGLASDLASQTRLSEYAHTRLQKNAEQALQMAVDADQEESIHFHPARER